MDNILPNILLSILPRSFYQEDTVVVARKLLGKKLVRIINNIKLVGIISETEAYRIDDPASHCFIGQTERNKSMFGPVGHAYIYISYGIHFCFNIVARDINNYAAGGVLIRAVIPIEGKELIKQNRKITDEKNLCNGPAKLTQAFKITKDLDGADLTNTESGLFITSGYNLNPSLIEATPRIGISVATDKLWRFKITSNFKPN